MHTDAEEWTYSGKSRRVQLLIFNGMPEDPKKDSNKEKNVFETVCFPLTKCRARLFLALEI